MEKTKYGWTPSNVSSSNVADMSVRTYLEIQQLRGFFHRYGISPGQAALEVGCGFGRLLVFLEDYFMSATGYEREPALVEDARRLLRRPIVYKTALTHLPSVDVAWGFVMTYTVLQHMTDRDAEKVISEIKRVAKPGASILLAENTNPSDRNRPHKDAGLFSNGRNVKWFMERMQPWQLVAIERRVTESKARRRTRDGHLMLFRWSTAPTSSIATESSSTAIE